MSRRKTTGTTTHSSPLEAAGGAGARPVVALPPPAAVGLLYRWFVVRSAALAAADAEDIAAFVLRRYGVPHDVRQGLRPAGGPAGGQHPKDPLLGLRRLLAEVAPGAPLVWDPTLAPYGLRFGYPEGAPGPPRRPGGR